MAASRGFGKSYTFYGDEIALIAEVLGHQTLAELTPEKLWMARRIEKMIAHMEYFDSSHRDKGRIRAPSGRLIFIKPRKEDE